MRAAATESTARLGDAALEAVPTAHATEGKSPESGPADQGKCNPGIAPVQYELLRKALITMHAALQSSQQWEGATATDPTDTMRAARAKRQDGPPHQASALLCIASA